MLVDQGADDAVQPLLAVPGVGGGVLFVERQGLGRRAEPGEGLHDLAAPRTGLQLEQAESPDQLGLQPAVGGQQAVQGRAVERALRQLVPRDALQVEGGHHPVVEDGVHVVGPASPHLVPVVGAHDDLGLACEPHLAGGDEVVEAGVGTAFQRQEAQQLDLIGAGREPVVHSIVIPAGDAPHGGGGVCGAGAAPARPPLQQVEERSLESPLEAGHTGVVLVALAPVEAGERCAPQLVDAEQCVHGVEAVPGLGVGKPIEERAIPSGDGLLKALGERLVVGTAAWTHVAPRFRCRERFPWFTVPKPY